MSPLDGIRCPSSVTNYNEAEVNVDSTLSMIVSVCSYSKLWDNSRHPCQSVTVMQAQVYSFASLRFI